MSIESTTIHVQLDLTNVKTMEETIVNRKKKQFIHGLCD